MALHWWRGRTSITAALGLILAVSAGVAWIVALGWRPSNKYSLQGIDVSEAQGIVHWPTVNAGGAQFAYVRATYGAAGRDTRFAANWADVDAAGMPRGALHVYSLCRPGVDQANNFITTVPRPDDALPPAVELDFHDDCVARPTRDALLADLRQFLTMIEAHGGKPALLKLTRRFERHYEVSAAIPRTIWAVQDFLPPDYAARPWRMWQASDMRRIDGVEGPVHWDVVAP